jgi:hypothetical protein
VTKLRNIVNQELELNYLHSGIAEMMKALGNSNYSMIVSLLEATAHRHWYTT